MFYVVIPAFAGMTMLEIYRLVIIMVVTMKLSKAFKYLDVKNVYKDVLRTEEPGKLVNKVRPFIRKKVAEFITEINLAREKLKDIPATNYKLGLHHLKQGNIQDAILRFRMVAYLAPEMADAYYNLGRCQLMNRETEAAKENLQKAIALRADFPEVKYILGKIASPESLDVIPESIIAEHLEWRSESWDEPDESIRQTDKFVVSTVLANITDKNPNLEVLDLGCGYGGRGILLRNKEVAKRIVGVDIYTKATSSAAKEMFAEEEVYSRISNDEVSKYLENNKEKFDVIFAGNVFSYRGKLEEIFANISKSLKPGGIFMLIVDKNDLDDGYKIDIATDEFIHSLEYFEETMKIAGLNIENKKEKEIDDRKINIILAKTSG